MQKVQFSSFKPLESPYQTDFKKGMRKSCSIMDLDKIVVEKSVRNLACFKINWDFSHLLGSCKK